MLIAVGRRYWFWQHKKMLRDNAGYLIKGGLRPLAVQWIKASDTPGGLTPIPKGWSPMPWLKPNASHR